MSRCLYSDTTARNLFRKTDHLNKYLCSTNVFKNECHHGEIWVMILHKNKSQRYKTSAAVIVSEFVFFAVFLSKSITGWNPECVFVCAL